MASRPRTDRPRTSEGAGGLVDTGMGSLYVAVASAGAPAGRRVAGRRGGGTSVGLLRKPAQMRTGSRTPDGAGICAR